MADANPFASIRADELGRVAEQRGFTREGRRNWVRRTADFIQLINLQSSQWSANEHYLNFALWPLAMGEPPSLAESKFPFRTRGEDLGATDLDSFFRAADGLRTLAELLDAERSGRVAGLMTGELRELLT